MKYVRLVAAVVLGMAAITIIAESIELFTVKTISGLPVSELQSDQDRYFEIRNGTAILLFKIFYSLLAAVIAGYLAAWFARDALRKTAAYVVMGIQTISVLWAALLSELSTTGPAWMWAYLVVVLPLGVWMGLRLRERHHPSKLA